MPTEKILVARVFSLQRQVMYQIKAKRLNYLIKDFISSNFKRRLSFLLSNSEVSSLLLKLQPFRVVKYSLSFYRIWLTDKRPKTGCEEICICLVLAELLYFKLKSQISSAIYAKKLTQNELQREIGKFLTLFFRSFICQSDAIRRKWIFINAKGLELQQ